MVSRSRRTRRALLLAAVSCALLVPAPAAHGEDETPPPESPVRVLRPDVVRGAALTQLGGIFEGPLSHGFLGATYSRQFHDSIAAEFTFGQGRGGERHGPFAGAGVRFSLGGRGRSAFTISPGGHVGFLNGYGPVGFGQLEAAWELRTRFGLALVVGGGVGLTLTTSRRVDDGCRGRWLGCHDDRFNAGDGTLHLRGELGFAF